MPRRLEERNYRNDHRVAGAEEAARRSFDEKKMRLRYELDDKEIELPAKFIVCPTCDGKGTHVNPSIDASGLTIDDFLEDPDFCAAYSAGVYDVPCYNCGGKRVIPTVDRDSSDPNDLQLLDDWEREEAAFRAMQRAERSMGA